LSVPVKAQRNYMLCLATALCYLQQYTE